MSRLLSKLYIKYTSTVDLEELNQRTHKLSMVLNDDSVRKTEVYRIPPNSTLETVLHCISVYKQKAQDIFFDHGDMFSHFSQLVEGSDLDNYSDARNSGPQNNNADFDRCMERFALNYCHRETKKHQFRHFTTAPEDYKKTAKTEIRVHANRLTAIQRAVNSLPPAGDDNITDNHKKECLLHSCPAQWQREFTVSGQSLENMTYRELVDWLEDIKVHADNEFSQQQERRKRDRDRNTESNQSSKTSRKYNRTQNYPSGNSGGRSSRRSNFGGRGSGRGYHGGRPANTPAVDPGLEPCRKHNGAHLWKDCPANWNSPNYQPEHNNRGGYGRGFPSRGGFGGGRFAGGRNSGRSYVRTQAYGGPTHQPQQPASNSNQQHYMQQQFPQPHGFDQFQFNQAGINRQYHGAGRGHGNPHSPSSNSRQNDQRQVDFYFNETFNTGNGTSNIPMPAGWQMDTNGNIECRMDVSNDFPGVGLHSVLTQRTSELHHSSYEM